MDILAAQAKAGRLVIAISHDLMLAARYADRVLVLNEGAVAAIGAPRDVLTPSLLRQVFRVESVRLNAGDGNIRSPLERDRFAWAASGSRGCGACRMPPFWPFYDAILGAMR